MSREEYEERYAEALQTIRDVGKTVGEPYQTHDGVRAVHIDGFPCRDELVFTETWGEELARDIMAPR